MDPASFKGKELRFNALWFLSIDKRHTNHASSPSLGLEGAPYKEGKYFFSLINVRIPPNNCIS